MLKSYAHQNMSILAKNAVMHQLIHIIHNFSLFIPSFLQPNHTVSIFVYMS